MRAKHNANLAWVLDDLAGWETAMVGELSADRFQNSWIRIHDSGDFFSDDYLWAWLRICHAHPNIRFYAYTKEVDRFRRLVEPHPPPNFRWVYSLGGTQDQALTDDDRVADVFPDEPSIAAAGWASQQASDLLAVLGPPKVGMSANRIPAFVKKLAGRRFSTWQKQETVLRTQRAERRRHALPADSPDMEPVKKTAQIPPPSIHQGVPTMPFDPFDLDAFMAEAQTAAESSKATPTARKRSTKPATPTVRKRPDKCPRGASYDLMPEFIRMALPTEMAAVRHTAVSRSWLW